jgi:hypothetical protein
MSHIGPALWWLAFRSLVSYIGFGPSAWYRGVVLRELRMPWGLFISILSGTTLALFAFRAQPFGSIHVSHVEYSERLSRRVTVG